MPASVAPPAIRCDTTGRASHGSCSSHANGIPTRQEPKRRSPANSRSIGETPPRLLSPSVAPSSGRPRSACRRGAARSDRDHNLVSLRQPVEHAITPVRSSGFTLGQDTFEQPPDLSRFLLIDRSLPGSKDRTCDQSPAAATARTAGVEGEPAPIREAGAKHHTQKV